MKCCALQTISLGADRPKPRAAAASALTAPRAFEALLLSVALKPVAKALGFYGDLVVERCVQGALVRESAAQT